MSHNRCHHSVGCFIYWVHVTSLTCKANVQSTETSPTRIDIVYTQSQVKGRFHWRLSIENFLLALSLEPVTFRPRSSLICSCVASLQNLAVSWHLTVGSLSICQYSGEPLCSSHQRVCPEYSPDFPRSWMPWKSFTPICLAYMLTQWSLALVFASSTPEFPRSLPSKYYLGPILLNLSNDLFFFFLVFSMKFDW